MDDAEVEGEKANICNYSARKIKCEQKNFQMSRSNKSDIATLRNITIIKVREDIYL